MEISRGNARFFDSEIFTSQHKNVLIYAFHLLLIAYCERGKTMQQLKPGALAIIIGARTAAGRENIGKSVELFSLCQPGERFINPVTGFMTELPKSCARPLWLVTGDVVAADGQAGFAFVRAEHLMPLDGQLLPLEETALLLD